MWGKQTSGQLVDAHRVVEHEKQLRKVWQINLLKRRRCGDELLSTGPIENNAVNGVRPTQTVTIRIDNRSDVTASSVQIQGYYMNAGLRVLYVSESFDIAPNQVVTNNYFANFDSFEFTFTTTTTVNDPIQVSVWGKRAQAL